MVAINMKFKTVWFTFLTNVEMQKKKKQSTHHGPVFPAKQIHNYQKYQFGKNQQKIELGHIPANKRLN